MRWKGSDATFAVRLLTPDAVHHASASYCKATSVTDKVTRLGHVEHLGHHSTLNIFTFAAFKANTQAGM